MARAGELGPKERLDEAFARGAKALVLLTALPVIFSLVIVGLPNYKGSATSAGILAAFGAVLLGLALGFWRRRLWAVRGALFLSIVVFLVFAVATAIRPRAMFTSMVIFGVPQLTLAVPRLRRMLRLHREVSAREADMVATAR